RREQHRQPCRPARLSAPDRAVGRGPDAAMGLGDRARCLRDPRADMRGHGVPNSGDETADPGPRAGVTVPGPAPGFPGFGPQGGSLDRALGPAVEPAPGRDDAPVNGPGPGAAAVVGAAVAVPLDLRARLLALAGPRAPLRRPHHADADPLRGAH